MDSFKAALEIRNMLEDRNIVLPTNPYDSRNLDEALRDFLDRFFDLAYSESEDGSNESAYNDGWAAGYDAAAEKIYQALNY